MDLEVKGFHETSFLDWDGQIVSVVYLPYCNFKCPFCHNFGLVYCPESYETIPYERIEKYLVSHKDFIDGVCITGGEPCLHKDKGLFDFIEKIKKLGFKIKIDTNGYDPETLKKLINDKLLDYIAMDIKGPLDERYDKLSGIKTDIKKIKESIQLIMDSGIKYEFRTTVIPGLLDKNDIVDIAKAIKGAQLFVVQQFVPVHAFDEALKTVKPYQKNEIEEMVKAVRPYVKSVKIRGA